MSKRSTASLARPMPHAFRADPDDKTICCAVVYDRRCALPERNALHAAQPGAEAVRVAYRQHDARQLGEHDEEGDEW